MDSDLSSLFVRTIGIIVVTILAILSINFAGAWAKEELRFIWDNLSGARYTADYESEFVESGYRVLYPPDLGFSLLIPRLGLNKKIVKIENTGVSLEDGLGFVEGSSYPDEGGVVFLVSHPPLPFLDKIRTNPEFFLARYLKVGDELVVVFGKRKFFYKVEKIETVSGFPSAPIGEDAVFLVAARPFSGSWVTILAKRYFPS